VGFYSPIEPRQRSVGNITPHRLLDYVADHFLQLPFGNFGRSALVALAAF
jgi:hypothetical protein